MSNERKRTEKEVIEAVLDYAGKDESVRAVIRTNLLPKREYDYLLIVTLFEVCSSSVLFCHFLYVLFTFCGAHIYLVRLHWRIHANASPNQCE